MNTVDRIELAHGILSRAIVAARTKGLRIVYNIDVERDEDGTVTGCCAVAALDYCEIDDRPPLPFSNDMMADEWDALEYGFDGVPFDKVDTMPRAWHELGARLRREFAPVEARPA